MDIIFLSKYISHACGQLTGNMVRVADMVSKLLLLRRELNEERDP